MLIFVGICDGICRDAEAQLREFENIACQKTEEGFFFPYPATLYLRLMFVVYGARGSNGENRTIKPGNPSLQDLASHVMHQHVNANCCASCIPFCITRSETEPW